MKCKLVLFLLFSSLLYGKFLPLYFQGNEQINERDLYAVLNLYKPYFYEFWKKEPAVDPQTAIVLAETIKDFYKSKGFFHTIVSHSQNDERISILIREGPPVRVADITTISELDIGAKIPFEKGTVFDAQKFSRSKKEIRLLYADHSYCNAQLNAKAWIDIEADSAYLMYEAIPNEPCYFDTIEVHPPQNIDSNIIRSLLYIKEKERFSPEHIRNSYESLYGYEGISKAIIKTEKESNNSVSVSVEVDETEKPIRFQSGVGVSSDEGMMLSAGIKHRNLFGNLKTLGVDARLTQIKQTVKTNFDMPLESRNSTGAEIGYENEKFTGFKEERFFGSLFLKQRRIPHTFQESLLFDKINTYESDDELLFPRGSLFVLSPRLQWTYDARDKLLDPTEGYFLRSEVKGSVKSEISDASYLKYHLTGGYIIPFLPSVVALKASFGSLRLYQGEVPASYRFYAGGMNSNRAYSYRKLGPANDAGDPTGSDSIFETTAEYRFPIYGDFRGVVFNDNTFLGNSFIPDYDNGYYSAGVGIRYITPIGPIAIDFGFDMANPREEYAFHFHVGELF